MPCPRTASPATSASAPSIVEAPLTAEWVARGEPVHGRAGCGLCHGARGEGDFGPPLAGTALAIEAVARQARIPSHPRMPAFSRDRVTDDEIVATYAFPRSLSAP